MLAGTDVFWGNRLLATYDSSQVYFQHIDPLGTVRVITGPTGSIVSSFSSMPYGDRFQPNGPDVDLQHFAELDRDASTDTHNATFRQYSSNQGRWMSPDPYDGSYDLANPQSLNRYSYVNNNPFSGNDPSGLQCTHGDCDSPGGDDGNNIIQDIVEGVEQAVEAIFHLKPAFHGSTSPRPGARGGSTADPWNESLGYPKGGPQLGGGWGVPGALGLPVDQGCEFGGCGSSFAGPGMEDHHIFPQAFQEWFEQHGIDIESYTVALTKAAHRLKPGGLHTKSGGNWNAAWKQWIEEHPNASSQEILNQGKRFLIEFGVGAGDVFSDFFIMVNPCVTNPNMPQCQMGYNLTVPIDLVTQQPVTAEGM